MSELAASQAGGTAFAVAQPPLALPTATLPSTMGFQATGEVDMDNRHNMLDEMNPSLLSSSVLLSPQPQLLPARIQASMTKVHPKAATAVAAAAAVTPASVVEENGEVSLTVWRRSLLFNGKGFTVFDCKGHLVYRVETYGGGSPREVVLMDAEGHGLFTIRRKKLSLADEWLIYDGDAAAFPSVAAPPKRFTARRHVSLRPTRCLAHLSPACRQSSVDVGAASSCRYDVEGSYAGRSLDVFASSSSGGEQRQRVATVCKKKDAAVGPDVFRLVVQPGFEPALAMAVVILLDQMNAS
ncbi:Protein LURP-one-related 8 [Dichanthelium oligosanthes]|uniref:Protein LURP-one-related 8 n=1 Tax=Dichanthelium oligosanthes TaxID=888268 RepID=A0A1E5VDC4_9POAL|nr:Protein LURP-one-related 8 [Dichanthelium oligosanthes]